MKKMNLYDSLKNFETMLQKLPDNSNSTFDFYRFFRSLQLINNDSIPFVELGTILKKKKPTVFSELRKQFGDNNLINIITSVDMDLDEAEFNIKKVMDSHVN
jgi:hypothetical protein